MTLTEILWHQFVTVVHDEDPAHIQLDVVPLLLVLKEVKRGPPGQEEQRTKLQLALH